MLYYKYKRFTGKYVSRRANIPSSLIPSLLLSTQLSPSVEGNLHSAVAAADCELTWLVVISANCMQILVHLNKRLIFSQSLREQKLEGGGRDEI